MGASRCVYDEGHHGGKTRCKCFGDDGTRGRPSEDLNLPRSVDNNVFDRGVTGLLTKANHLTKQHIEWDNPIQ